MPYSNDHDKKSPKLNLTLLAGISDPPSSSFVVYFNDDGVILDCMKFKIFGKQNVIATYSIPYSRIITMDVLAEDTIDEIEQGYLNKLDLKPPLYSQSREMIRTLSHFEELDAPVQRIVVLSLAYYSASGEVNDLVFSIVTCGFDAANNMAKYLRIKIGIDEPDKPTTYFMNDKGEYQL